MPSLKREVEDLVKQQGGWFTSTSVRNHKRKHDEISTSNKRVGFVEQCGNRDKRRLFHNADDLGLGKSEFGVSRDNMEDEDYIEFLGILSKNMDFYARSGDYCLDLPSKKNLVEDFDCSFENVVDEEVDPHYKIFLENVRQDGYSYVFEMENEDGVNVCLKYEHKEEIPNDDNEKSDNNHLDDTSCQDTQNGANDKIKPNMAPLDNDSEKITEYSSQKPAHTTSNWFLLGCKPGSISGADESYLKFLDHVWVKGDSLIYKCEDVIVKYEDDGEVATDSIELGEKLMSSGNEKKIAPVPNQKTSKMDTSDDDSDSVQILDERSMKRDYKNKLLEKLKQILKMPFDEKELIEKLKDAEDHKALERTRETRRGSVSYATPLPSLSYLDHHTDLANMVKAAQLDHNPGRALALLRCLFFYYEHVSHHVSFVPWKYPPTWLHNIICCCHDNSKCPMKYGMPDGKKA